MNRGSSCRLEIDGVAKAFGAVKAVESVSLSVQPSEILALLGPSGCGKTTLLQSIAGFVVPDSGDIRLDGPYIYVKLYGATSFDIQYINYRVP